MSIIRVPADLSNPGYDVLGGELTNPPGYTHNGAESLILQTDNDTNNHMLDRIIFSDDGATYNGRSLNELVTYANSINGTDGAWVKLWTGTNGELVAEIVTYDYDWHYNDMTEAQFDKIAGWFGGTPAPAPFPVKAVDANGDLAIDFNVDYAVAYEE